MRRSHSLVLAASIALAATSCSGPLFPVRQASGMGMLRVAASATERASGPATPSRAWCSPERGAPADPTLGLISPLRIGIGSIVTVQDGTTESFLAHDAWRDTTWVEGRTTRVMLVDHPTDADYAISGEITGDLAYAREDRGAGPLAATAIGLGYFGGGGALLAGTIVAIVDEPPDTIITLGVLGMAVGLAGHIAVWRGKANAYHWNVTGHFTLRRNGVRIGEFFVDEHGDEARYQPRGATYRPMVLGRLWQKAHAAIAACIASDVGQLAAAAKGTGV